MFCDNLDYFKSCHISFLFVFRKLKPLPAHFVYYWTEVSDFFRHKLGNFFSKKAFCFRFLTCCDCSKIPHFVSYTFAYTSWNAKWSILSSQVNVRKMYRPSLSFLNQECISKIWLRKSLLFLLNFPINFLIKCNVFS